jgi:hypothetical protein
MSKVKVGDVVHLKSDSEFLFVVTKDFEKDTPSFVMGNPFEGMFRITGIDKKNDNEIKQLDVHEDTFVVVQK